MFKRTADRKIVYMNRLSSGSIESMEDYNLTVGKLRGIEESELEIKDLYKYMFESPKGREGEEYES